MNRRYISVGLSLFILFLALFFWCFPGYSQTQEKILGETSDEVSSGIFGGKISGVEKSYSQKNDSSSGKLESENQKPLELKNRNETSGDKSTIKTGKKDNGVKKAGSIPKNTPQNSPGEGAANVEPEGGEPFQYEEPAFEQKTISYPLLVLRTIAILAAIIIGIYLLFRFLLKSKGKVIADTDIIRVLATYPLSPNRVIQIVEIAEKVLVLGVTESNINLIMSVDDKEYADRIKLLSSKEKTEGGGFKEQFMRFIGGSGMTKGGKISYLNNYKDRIKKMKKL